MPVLPTLPIEIRFEAWPFERSSLVGDGDDYIFKFHRDSISYSEKEIKDLRLMLHPTFPGTEFLNSILAITEPQQLVTFMNTYVGLMGLVRDSDDGRYPSVFVPFRWSTFIDAQTKLKDAMRLPIAKLLRHAETGRAFRLDTLTITTANRGGAYYGTVTMKPTLGGCYRVIAVERLLANVEYGFCERCGKPFRVTSKHQRKYCDTSICGHAVAQQAYRDRENGVDQSKLKKN